MPTMNIKGVTEEAYGMLYEASAIRRLTYAEYVERLARLHHICRAIADAGDARLQAELVALGLETVHERPARPHGRR